MKVFQRLNRAAALAASAALALAQTAALAQTLPPVVVTFGTDVTSVPTLSQWGMLVVSALLAASAVRALRKKAGSKTVVSLAVAALVSFGVFGDARWLNGAWANGYTTYYLSAGTNGQLSVPSSSAFAYVNNNTAIPQTILGISPLYAEQREEGGNPPCYVGMKLAQNQSCSLRTRPPV